MGCRAHTHKYFWLFPFVCDMRHTTYAMTREGAKKRVHSCRLPWLCSSSGHFMFHKRKNCWHFLSTFSYEFWVTSGKTQKGFFALLRPAYFCQNCRSLKHSRHFSCNFSVTTTKKYKTFKKEKRPSLKNSTATTFTKVLLRLCFM